jgi:hypothetical protein
MGVGRVSTTQTGQVQVAVIGLDDAALAAITEAMA